MSPLYISFTSDTNQPNHQILHLGIMQLFHSDFSFQDGISNYLYIWQFLSNIAWKNTLNKQIYKISMLQLP